MNNQFLGTVTIFGEIECITGLHIGGTSAGYEIGGMDNPVIRDSASDFPYIPGSSLKGKMRSMLEWAKGLVSADGEVHKCTDINCNVCLIFGSSPVKEEQWKGGPTRLTVRDAYPTETTKEAMKKLREEKGLPMTEYKTENNINRITSKAIPRPVERVTAGSRFDLELQYFLFNVNGSRDKDLDLFPKVFEALRLVEASALGGGSSRGSGQVKFWIYKEPMVKSVEDYRQKVTAEKPSFKSGDLISVSKFDVECLKKKVQEKIKCSSI